ncbi:MAG TPA: riboflavin biosynthesis protein RibF [Clostridiales bacterium]|nr:riboflavin biosynthesis protein RibF [Clostridiales bacterium]
MKILHETDFPLQEHTACAFGLFDGVHLGHQALVEDILKRQGEKSTIYTFDSKPACGAHIFTEKEKRYILASMGVERYYSREFDNAFSRLAPEAFIKKAVTELRIRHITVGYDFRFGQNAVGDAALLKALAPKYGYSLSVVPEIDKDGFKVSSSKVREMVQNGDMTEAMRLLGRYYFADGRIEKGAGLGREIGFPTANFTTEKLLPMRGVYATVVLAGGKLLRGVTNVGRKPTVKQDARVNVETFILDFDGDIYGETLRVFFIELLREERRFSGIEALRAEIARNSAAAKGTLRDLEVYKPYLLC